LQYSILFSPANQAGVVADTLGVLIPSETYTFLHHLIQRYPALHFDFHAHNDYDLGTANVLEAVKAGVHGLHLTINGMGERAGNAPLASAIAVLNDYMKEVRTSLWKAPCTLSANW
jgi:D-citramalate synthase